MLRFLLALVVAFMWTVPPAALADPGVLEQQPRRRLALQFAANANVFTIVNPDADGTPLTLTSATGVTPANGLVMVSVGAGFTAPVTLTALYWQMDDVTTTKAGYRRLGPAATGSNTYVQSLDAHYTSCVFSGPPNTPFIILASGAITGDVYINARAHASNANSATGY